MSAKGGGALSTGFGQPLGRNFHPGSLRGYYVDFRVKAPEPRWPPPELGALEDALHVTVAQWGLGAYEQFLETGDEAWLAGARACGEHLVRGQHEDGGWPHLRPFPHTFKLDPPWLSAMAQGEGASLLVRLGLHGDTERFAQAARRALRPLHGHRGEGGLRAPLGDGWFLEEYPTDPPSHVLNGGIFALWGLYDAGLALEDPSLLGEFEEGVDALTAGLPRWDLGWWTRYDLYPHRLVNVASVGYQELHVTQLQAMNAVAPRAELAQAAERFSRQLRSRPARVRALARKVAFRLAVPRRRPPR